MWYDNYSIYSHLCPQCIFKLPTLKWNFGKKQSFAYFLHEEWDILNLDFILMQLTVIFFSAVFYYVITEFHWCTGTDLFIFVMFMKDMKLWLDFLYS